MHTLLSHSDFVSVLSNRRVREYTDIYIYLYIYIYILSICTDHSCLIIKLAWLIKQKRCCGYQFCRISLCDSRFAVLVSQLYNSIASLNLEVNRSLSRISFHRVLFVFPQEEHFPSSSLSAIQTYSCNVLKEQIKNHTTIRSSTIPIRRNEILAWNKVISRQCDVRLRYNNNHFLSTIYSCVTLQYAAFISMTVKTDIFMLPLISLFCMCICIYNN